MWFSWLTIKAMFQLVCDGLYYIVLSYVVFICRVRTDCIVFLFNCWQLRTHTMLRHGSRPWIFIFSWAQTQSHNHRLQPLDIVSVVIWMYFFSDKEQPEIGREKRSEKNCTYNNRLWSMCVFFSQLIVLFYSHCNRLSELPFIKYIYYTFCSVQCTMRYAFPFRSLATRDYCVAYFSSLLLMWRFVTKRFRFLSLCTNKIEIVRK